MLVALGVLTVLALTALTGFFVAQEFAFVSVDRTELRARAEGGDARAQKAYDLTTQLSFLLSGAQFGITVTTLLVGYAAEPLIGAGLRDLVGAEQASRGATAVAISLGVLLFSTIVQMVLGELGPKNWAIARPVALTRALAAPTAAYLAVVGPVVRFFDSSAAWLLRKVGIEPVEELDSAATPEDLQRIIDQSHASGLLDDELQDLLDRGLAFRHRTVGEVMTPRVDVETVSADASVAELVDLLATGHSRYPVYGRDIDDIVGVVSISDVLEVPVAERASTVVHRIVDEAVLLPTSLGVTKALEEMRRRHRQIAVVVDEHGGFAGVVSFEDIAEEVVGDILDEDDEEESPATERADGTWLLPANLRLDEVRKFTSIALPESDDYDTLSGLVLKTLGRVVQEGDVAEVAWTVRDADGETVRACTSLEVVAVERHVPDEVLLAPVTVDDVEEVA
ncbi:HlyC/CorC family transporter [Kytococcus schroeteri]|uniref:HlyC/CorC family transporter n=1 Tax=Kytococcus schroeteri TaxID=138300 RepID=A0A2I1P9N9_9MICO|nr:hemolysin family protein [Kytococcus schroeteri]PKZ41349.1 HlyC/CorC family transporter [Kytococcus schroeteri]